MEGAVTAHTLAARVGRAWFSILILGSAALIFVTFLAFALDLPEGGSRLLFWLALAGENNVGAWWSGMLLMLASVFALDGFAANRARPTERSGWLALAAVLLVLSFDEIGALHEYLGSRGIRYLALLAVPLFVLTCYAFIQLLRAPVSLRTLVLLMLAFALLGTVPLQEYIQQTREWPNPIVYGLRGALEEGVELAAILLLVAVTSHNTCALIRRPGGEPFELARHRPWVLGTAAVLAPVLVAATSVLPYPGGPADWLAAGAYFCCALLVARSMLGSAVRVTGPVLVLFGWYLVASVGSNAMRLEWDPNVLGVHVSIRGLFVALLLVTAGPVLRRAGRRANPLLFGVAAAVAVAVSSSPQAEILWCGLPVLVALNVYWLESGWVASRAARRAASSEMLSAGSAKG
jgi:hypothetical protein